MNIAQPKIDLKNNFELYLEGVKVDFLAISISEQEGGIPAASITFPSNHGALRLLPGTIVQIFGYYHREKSTFLVFEGEVTAVNFQKTDSSKIVVIKAVSLLGSMIKAKFRPSDAIITQELKDTTGIQGSQNVIFNSKDSVGPTTVGDMPKVKSNQPPTTIEGKSNDIGLSAVFGLTDEFKRFLAEDQPGGKGDFIPMLQQFNTYFENNDLYYGLKALAYKFGRTIFAAPNPELSNKLKVDLFQEALNKVQSSGISDIFGEAPYVLMQVLTEFQRYLHYALISPANYTACQPFYLDKNVTTWEPLRMIYTPRLESGPPALCNVFFPEQVSSFTYSREMMGEPTRVVGKATIPLLNSVNKMIDFSPCAVYPSIEFDSEKAVGNFTTEETYRGINYKITSYTNLHSDLISKIETTTGNGVTTTKNRKMEKDDMEKGEIGQLIRPYAYMDFLDMKYGERQTSMNAEWSPFRMIGLPGMLLDPDGITIVGVLYQIQTDITAQGSAISRITMRNTRIVHDGEFEKSAFSNIPSDITYGNEKYIIHDLTTDGIMATNELLYDQDLYSFENIGKDVYTYIAYGMLSPNEGFKKAKLEKGIFKYSNDRLTADDTEIQVSPRIDNSVLNYLGITDGAYSFEIPKVYNSKPEIRNTYLLYKAISELRKAYENSKHKMDKNEKVYDMEKAYDFMYATNRRNIITKEEYFNFIGANVDRTLQTDDAYDADTIFKDGAQALREELHTRVNEQYSTVITPSNSEQLSIQSRINVLNKRISDYTKGNTIKSESSLVADYINNRGYSKSHAEIIAKENWAIVEADKEQLEIEKKNLSELKVSSSSTKPNQEPVKDKEMYKPYNMTRRMHVVLAFKDTIDIYIDDKKSKLTVTK